MLLLMLVATFPTLHGRVVASIGVSPTSSHVANRTDVPSAVVAASSSGSHLTHPDDPFYPRQWGLNNRGQRILTKLGTIDADIDAPQAWEHITHSDVIVAIIDSGADLWHDDLFDNIWTKPGEIPGNMVDDDGNGYVDDVVGWNFVGPIFIDLDGDGEQEFVSGEDLDRDGNFDDVNEDIDGDGNFDTGEDTDHDGELGRFYANDYDYMSGTSMAAPFVSGSVAHFWTLFPALSHLEVKDWILRWDRVDSRPGIAGANGRVLSGMHNDGRLRMICGDDFGDAPDPFTAQGFYPTKMRYWGASHEDIGEEWLGFYGDVSPEFDADVESP